MADGEISGKTNEAWEKILEKYPIEDETRDGGVYVIEASAIKEFREPRLMTKFDTSKSVASPLKRAALNVLPTSRHSYAIGRFDLYMEFPDVSKLRPEQITLPDFETLRVENLTSESNAINALLASHTLERFLDEEDMDFCETFNGRMGTGDFSFKVDLVDCDPWGRPLQSDVAVSHAQLEIDGGFESQRSVTIMEAKNIRHDDFNVRQLYFPYRKYRSMVTKPIRLVFSQYTNLTYYLYEYEFTNPNSFSSIALVNMAAYTFEDRQISFANILDIWEKTVVRTDDNQDAETGVPFIQADRFDRVIALVERLGEESDSTMKTSEITDFMGTVPRQANYYPAAGIYLGLMRKPKNGLVSLTGKAKEILRLKYRDRQLAYVGLMFEHEIFHSLFEDVRMGSFPEKNTVMRKMLDLNVCNDGSTVTRRAQTVISWIRWIIDLVDE